MRLQPTYTLFVASPDELAEERRLVEEVVKELNLQFHGFRLELIRWETHATPGVGSDPQDVVNRSIPADFDILIGLLWTRLGTPTPRAGSGTLEELENALGRAKDNPRAVGVMLYFKDAPVAPSQLDADQLKEVVDFRATLSGRGCLHWSFQDKNELAQYLRLHIPREVTRLREAEAGGSPTATAEKAGVASSLPVEEEEGFLNLMEYIEDGVELSTTIINRLAEDTRSLGEKMDQRTRELAALPSRHGQPDHRGARRIADNVANDLDAYAGRIEADLPRLSEAYEVVFDSITRGIGMAMEAQQMSPGELKKIYESASDLASTIETAESHILSFRTSVAATPRATTKLNHARRRTVKALDSLLAEFVRLKTTAQEIVPPGGKADALHESC